MNGYLVLNNGLVLKGSVSDSKINVVGDIMFGNDNSISIISKSATNKISFSKEDFINFENKFKNTSMVGKIVTDKLPLEHHMYDVKSQF